MVHFGVGANSGLQHPLAASDDYQKGKPFLQRLYLRLSQAAAVPPHSISLLSKLASISLRRAPARLAAA
jgi:hypothetical protein